VIFPESNKKTTQRSSDRSERSVKFASESREERNNRRNREDRPSTAPADFNRFVCIMLFFILRRYSRHWLL
jgi:hypothetical protein